MNINRLIKISHLEPLQTNPQQVGKSPRLAGPFRYRGTTGGDNYQGLGFRVKGVGFRDHHGQSIYAFSSCFRI